MNGIVKKSDSELTDIVTGQPLTQNNKYGINIGVAPNMTVNNKTEVFVIQDSDEYKLRILQGLSTNFCHLFIIRDEDFSGNCFSIKRKCTFTKDTSKALCNRLDSLSDESMIELKNYPTLFLDTNRAYRQPADLGQKFYIGYIDKIIPSKREIKIKYERLQTRMSQHILCQNAEALGIYNDDGKDIFNTDEALWVIKELNLLQALFDMGYDFFKD